MAWPLSLSLTRSQEEGKPAHSVCLGLVFWQLGPAVLHVCQPRWGSSCPPGSRFLSLPCL